MSTRVKLIIGGMLAAVAAAAWIVMAPSAELLRSFAKVQEPALAAPERGKESKAEAAANRVLLVQGPVPQGSVAAPKPVKRLDPPAELTEQALVGTKWERDGFRLEFGAAGKLLIGGRERAQWRVEGQRVRLYRDATGEEHWLDISGNKLLWNGQELSQSPVAHRIRLILICTTYPHPGPLPSDGRGRIVRHRSADPIAIGVADARSGCSLSRRTGEGQGEGKRCEYPLGCSGPIRR